MIIQVILIGGLLLSLLYGIIQRQKSRLLSNAISLVSVLGMFFVAFPERTTELAHFVGVGRGADLILYCWLVISIIVSMHLHLQILQLHEFITELARELALLAPRRSHGD